MGSPSDDRAPLRFPHAAGALCLACLAAAAWLWMRYSYCWAVTPEAFPAENPGAVLPFSVSVTRHAPSVARRYVMLTGKVWLVEETFDAVTREISLHRVLVCCPGGAAYVRLADAPAPTSGKESRTYRGRVRVDKEAMDFMVAYEIDTGASRFTGESVAGLVVGAMGVFVFTLALRHWLAERRPRREEVSGTLFGCGKGS